MEPLEPPDLHYLRAASGWLGLGDWRSAGEELEKIDPSLSAHPSILLVRYEIYSAAGNWDLAAEIASTLLQDHPDDPQVWILAAYATRRKPGGGIEQARKILLQARQLFSKEPIISYNLACYDCQLGNLVDAASLLKTAFALGDPKQFRSMALNDPDLKPLWTQIKDGLNRD
jgi:tetratricopeptide (TPR) repeat protein